MAAHRTSFKPLELAPEWLTESPITFDDLRCTTYPPTLWRVSLPPTPATPHTRTRTHTRTRKNQHRRDSVASIASSLSSSSSSSSIASDEIEELSKAGSPQFNCQDHERARARAVPVRVSTHLAPEDASSFLFYHDDDDNDGDDEHNGLHVGRWAHEREDDEATLNEQGPGPDVLVVEEEDPSPIDPFFKPKSQPHSLSASLLPLPSPPLHQDEPVRAPSADSSEYVHSRGSSFDCASPWFMHVSAGALAALDDQLLQSPVDAFADLCYARAVQLPDAAPVPYSWRRFSRLRPLSPFSDIHEEEEGEGSSSGSDSDGDDDEVVSPSADWQTQGVRPRIYSPTPHAHRDAHPPAHPRHYAHESDGSIQFRSQIQTLSPTALLSTHGSKPLPLHPPPTPSPPPSLNAGRSPYDIATLRGAAASPPPSFLPLPAVSQAQLALLFGAQAPPKPSESVHFFPATGSAASAAKGSSWSRRGVQALRITTNTHAHSNSNSSSSNSGAGSGGSTPATATTTNGGGWFQRGLRAIRA
ncbi:hypothetical protein GSI_04819 [Ganoderma sinense ZZ0214-1]|uniref:Uncharacterized protein n=1 Tax=Ganoderma sinense ZZ0214-1 TaxID=1077348 RepID=A0A2G8SG13_9APHY|nr:hypothetical protein GSI_04819 [Ganoderma sinense ZZ0214-1]